MEYYKSQMEPDNLIIDYFVHEISVENQFTMR